MLVAEAVGRALAGLGVDTVFGLMGSGNLTVTNALRDAGARFYRRPPRGGRDLHGRRLRAGERAARGVQRPPGPRADERDDRPDRGGQEPHAADRARGRHARARRCARTSASTRSALVEAVGRRPSASTAGHGARRRRPRGAPRARRAPRGGADAAARRAGADARGAAGARRRARSRRRAPPSRRWRRSPTCSAAARRPAIIAGRGAVLAGAGPALRALGERTGALLATAPWPTGCSPATPTTSASPAASRRRSPRGCSARPTSSSPSAPR